MGEVVGDAAGEAVVSGTEGTVGAVVFSCPPPAPIEGSTDVVVGTAGAGVVSTILGTEFGAALVGEAEGSRPSWAALSKFFAVTTMDDVVDVLLDDAGGSVVALTVIVGPVSEREKLKRSIFHIFLGFYFFCPP